MRSIILSRPVAGASESVSFANQTDLALGFDPAAGEFSRNGSDLVISFEDGGSVSVQNFFVEGQALPETVSLADGAVIPIADFMKTFAADIELDTAAGPSSSAPASGGAGEYGDNAGDLIDGLDRLGSLGTDQYKSESSAPETFLSPSALVTQGATPGVPGTADSGDPAGGAYGNAVMIGYVPAQLIMAMAEIAPGSDPYYVMAGQIPGFTDTDTFLKQFNPAADGWEQVKDTNYFVKTGDNGGKFIINAETGYFGYQEPGQDFVKGSFDEGSFFEDNAKYTVTVDGQEVSYDVKAVFADSSPGGQAQLEQALAENGTEWGSRTDILFPGSGWGMGQNVVGEHENVLVTTPDVIIKEAGLDTAGDSVLDGFWATPYSLNNVSINTAAKEGEFDPAHVAVPGDNDVVDLSGVSISKGTIELGQGDDLLNTGDLKSVEVDMGNGNDAMMAGSISNSSIVMGDGDDVMMAGYVSNSFIMTGDGDDTVTVESVSGDDSLKIISVIDTGDGDDIVTVGEGNLANSTTSSVNISLGDGNDALHIFTNFGNDVLLDGGGNDPLDLGADLSHVGDILSVSTYVDAFGWNEKDFNFDAEKFSGVIVKNFEALRVDFTDVLENSPTVNLDSLLDNLRNLQSADNGGAFKALIITGETEGSLKDSFESENKTWEKQDTTTVNGMGDTQFDCYKGVHGGQEVYLYVEVGLNFGI